MLSGCAVTHTHTHLTFLYLSSTRSTEIKKFVQITTGSRSLCWRLVDIGPQRHWKETCRRYCTAKVRNADVIPDAHRTLCRTKLPRAAKQECLCSRRKMKAHITTEHVSITSACESKNKTSASFRETWGHICDICPWSAMLPGFRLNLERIPKYDSVLDEA